MHGKKPKKLNTGAKEAKPMERLKQMLGADVPGSIQKAFDILCGGKEPQEPEDGDESEERKRGGGRRPHSRRIRTKVKRI